MSHLDGAWVVVCGGDPHGVRPERHLRNVGGEVLELDPRLLLAGSRVEPLTNQNPPSCPFELVALTRFHAPFLRVFSIRLSSRHTVELLTETPATAFRYSHLFECVGKGRSDTSCLSNLLALSSSFGRRPSLFFGASEWPSSDIEMYRFTEESETPKVRATSLFPILRPRTASTIFSLRSKEYAFIYS